jgi:hypothetical protein
VVAWSQVGCHQLSIAAHQSDFFTESSFLDKKRIVKPRGEHRQR